MDGKETKSRGISEVTTSSTGRLRYSLKRPSRSFLGNGSIVEATDITDYCELLCIEIDSEGRILGGEGVVQGPPTSNS